MSPNAPKKTGGKIQVYTSPKQTALDSLLTQDFHYTDISKYHSGKRGQIFLTQELQQL